MKELGGCGPNDAPRTTGPSNARRLSRPDPISEVEEVEREAPRLISNRDHLTSILLLSFSVHQLIKQPPAHILATDGIADRRTCGAADFVLLPHSDLTRPQSRPIGQQTGAKDDEILHAAVGRGFRGLGEEYGLHLLLVFMRDGE